MPLINNMKKTLLSLTVFTTAFSVFFGVVSALDITDVFSNEVPLVDDAYTQVLNDYDSSWWYFNNDVVECKSNNWSLTVTSPTIEDSGFDAATAYRLFISPYRVWDIKNWNANIDTSKIIMKEQKIESSDENVTFQIWWWELDPDLAYYWFILPIDIYDWIGVPSSEICFQLDQNVCMLDSACDTLDLVINPVKEPEPEVVEETHGAAGECSASIDLINPSYSTDGKNITLTWTAVPAGDTLDIVLLNPEEEVFEKIATVKMSDEKYVYKMRWSGVHEFRFTNECWEAKLKQKIEEGIKSEPEKIVAPATGPAENVMYIAIAAIVLYGLYAIFFRKSDNN